MHRKFNPFLVVVCTICVIAVSSCGHQHGSLTYESKSKWNSAIVRRVNHKLSTLIGVNYDPSFLAAVSKLNSEKQSSDGVYVTLLGDHSLKTVNVSNHRELIGMAINSRPPKRFRYAGPWESGGYSRSTVGANRLDMLVGIPEIIVIGTVTSIAAEEHVPPSSTNARQHTLYSFVIDTVLKTPSFPMTPKQISYLNGIAQIPVDFDDLPPVIGVSVAIGSLPWQENNSKGVGYRLEEELPLAVGSRYLLFLRSGSQADCRDCGSGDQPNTAGLEVYSSAIPYRSVIAISKGLTCVPEFSEAGEWKLRSDYGKIDPSHQLFNLKEIEVVTRLNKAMMNDRVRSEQSRLQAIDELRKQGHIK